MSFQSLSPCLETFTDESRCNGARKAARYFTDPSGRDQYCRAPWIAGTLSCGGGALEKSVNPMGYRRVEGIGWPGHGHPLNHRQGSLPLPICDGRMPRKRTRLRSASAASAAP